MEKHESQNQARHEPSSPLVMVDRYLGDRNCDCIDLDRRGLSKSARTWQGRVAERTWVGRGSGKVTQKNNERVVPSQSVRSCTYPAVVSQSVAVSFARSFFVKACTLSLGFLDWKSIHMLGTLFTLCMCPVLFCCAVLVLAPPRTWNPCLRGSIHVRVFSYLGVPIRGREVLFSTCAMVVVLSVGVMQKTYAENCRKLLLPSTRRARWGLC